jgi:hypothetical protein
MEFVTIHQLSREFDLPARVVRYRFHQLRQEGKLKEGDDFRRDDYVDEQHFVWKINPLSFVRETGLNPASHHHSTIPFPETVTRTEPVVNQTVNQTPPPVNKTANQPEPPNAEPAPTYDNVVTKEPSQFEYELVDFLKDQIRVKDDQIRDYSDQLKKVNDLNVKLIGQTVQQSQKIENLLRLTGGKMDLAETVTKTGNQSGEVVNDGVDQTPSSGNRSVNEEGSAQAA